MRFIRTVVIIIIIKIKNVTLLVSEWQIVSDDKFYEMPLVKTSSEHAYLGYVKCVLYQNQIVFNGLENVKVYLSPKNNLICERDTV